MKTATLVPIILLCGCAHFAVRQVDESPDERTITTEISGYTLFTSAQTLAKIKAIQTDKSQSVGAEGVGQHGMTNAVETLDALSRLLQALRP